MAEQNAFKAKDGLPSQRMDGREPCPLLEIPAEIRLHIYNALLALVTKPEEARALTALLKTCTRIYSEATPVFIRHTRRQMKIENAEVEHWWNAIGGGRLKGMEIPREWRQSARRCNKAKSMWLELHRDLVTERDVRWREEVKRRSDQGKRARKERQHNGQ